MTHTRMSHGGSFPFALRASIVAAALFALYSLVMGTQATVAADPSEAKTPTHYIYQGKAVDLGLDAERLAVLYSALVTSAAAGSVSTARSSTVGLLVG